MGFARGGYGLTVSQSLMRCERRLVADRQVGGRRKWLWGMGRAAMVGVWSGRSICSRTRASACLMSRETCIWLTPMRWAISVLREVVLEAQAQDLLIAVAEDVEGAVDERALLGALDFGVDDPSESARVTSSPVGSSSERVRRALMLWMAARTSSKGVWMAVAISCTVGERPSSWVSLSRALATRSCSSCSAARDAHGPCLVAEVAFDLAQDGRRGVGGEAHVAREIEAVDRLHEPDAGDLHEVVQRLAAVGVARGEGAGQWEHLLRELIPRAGVGVLVNAPQQLALSGSAMSGAAVDLRVLRAISRRRLYELGEAHSLAIGTKRQDLIGLLLLLARVLCAEESRSRSSADAGCPSLLDADPCRLTPGCSDAGRQFRWTETPTRGCVDLHEPIRGG